MLVSRIDRLLARTDPFDLAQAVERYVSTLSGAQVRALLRATGPKLGSYYRDELGRLAGARDFSTALEQSSDADLHAAVVQFLKSNLRAIPIFGTAFGLAVLQHAPVDRAVAIGEERPNRGMRVAVIAGAALALVAAGAAGERVVVGARAAQTPPPIILAEPVAAPTAPPLHLARTPMKQAVARADSPTPMPSPPETAAPSAPPSAAPATPPPSTPLPDRRIAVGQPPSGKGQAVVTAAPPTPSPEPSDIDVEDMPESYSDATPLPQQSPATAQPQLHAIRVPTPKPSPQHHGWLHRTIMHLDPFKPNP